MANLYIYTYIYIYKESILEIKGMRVIFQKKGRKGHACLFFFLKKSSLMCATIACMKQLEYDLIYMYIFKTQINIEIVALHISLNPFIFARMIKKKM